MFVRFLCNWPPYRDGQCLEVNDRFGSHFVARCMAEEVTGADVQTYARTIDRAIDKRISGRPHSAASPGDPGGHSRAARRVVTEGQWEHEIGQDQPGYWQAARAHRQAQQQARLLADITVRG
jgi:hypothetical protein